jgi:hypothetical protein
VEDVPGPIIGTTLDRIVEKYTNAQLTTTAGIF